MTAKTKLFPVSILSNGIIIGNFSAPLPYHFMDGTILKAVDKNLVPIEQLTHVEVTYQNQGGWIDLDRKIELSAELIAYAELWLGLYSQHSVNIVLVPLPLMAPLRAYFENNGMDILATPFRVACLQDRTTGLLRIDQFLI